MPLNDDTAKPVNPEDATLHVATEPSGKSRAFGVKVPGSGKVGLHVLKPSDTLVLNALVGRHREAGSDSSGSAVRIPCFHEAGFEGSWPAR